MSEAATALALIDSWRLRVRSYQKAHYDTAEQLGRRNQLIGVPVIVLSAVVGTSIFATLSKDVATWSRVAVGLVSIAVAVLSSLQTFFRYTERAEKHREAAIHYGILNRELERLRAFPPSDEEARSTLKHIEEKLNQLAQNTPAIPLVFLKNIRKSLELKTGE